MKDIYSINTKLIPLGLIDENEGQIDGVPANPRFINEDKFEDLKKSISEDTEFMSLNPLKVYPLNGRYVAIGGNMRRKALEELGFSEAPCIVFNQDTPVEVLKARIMKDNYGYGEWDKTMLAEDWDMSELEDWGMEDLAESFVEENVEDNTQNNSEDDNINPYSNVLDSPIYQPTGACPNISDIIDTKKTDSLLSEIESSQIPDDIKQMLRICSYRHTKINFSLMAEYYANAPKEVQELMEKNALVIIDFHSAIEQGYAVLRKEIMQIYNKDTTDIDEE